jgi:Guanine nucleotide exchange factor in Golgi transport N-terminal
MVLIGLVKCLTNIIDKCEHTINRISELKNLIKNRIVELVGQLLLTFDSKCLKNTCQLILTLFKRLRHLLKKELYILLDMIIINSLRSSTSEFYQKHYLLNLISNLLSQKDILVDIFTNYDCCPGYGNTLSKIFATLCICMSRSRDHEERVRA